MLVLNNPILTMAVYYLGFCITGSRVLENSVGKEKMKEVFEGFTRYNKPELPTLILIFIATAILWFCTLLIRPGMIDPEIISNGLNSLGMPRERYWYAAGFLMIANPICEEILWREGILRFLITRLEARWAVIVSGLLFAGYHPIVVGMLFPPAWLLMIFILTFLGGIFLANLYLRTRQLGWPIAVHAVININLMIIGWLYSPSSTP